MLKLRFFTKPALILSLLACFSLAMLAGEPSGEKGKSQIRKSATNDNYQAILINNVMNYYANNGDGSFNPYTSDNEGFEFPKGSGGDVIFEDGLVWGGFVRYPTGSIKKVGGSTYYHGLQAGKILTPGVNGAGMVAEDPGLAKNRIYRVRPDIGPSTNENDPAIQAKLSDEVKYLIRFEPTINNHSLYTAYITDWNQWPAADGAPYKDVNGNGSYDPGTDIPGVPGADQTLWYVANDMDASRAYNIGGVTPIGMEQQTTIWGYNRSGALASALFQRYKIINKSGVPIDSLYFCKWSDPDLGGALGAGDDFVGCDTTLNMGYVYNGTNNDGFYGSAVPAGGFTFFEGPRVKTGNPSDSAYFGGQVIHGYKNLRMTTFNMFINGSPTYQDPTRNSPNATIQWYNLLNGLVGLTGAAYINPLTGQPTKFVMSGDPVKHSGWIEGQLAPPGDRRLCIVSGYISMAAGDTQEVVVSNLAANGGDRLSSVALLKFYATFGQVAFNNNFDLANPPVAPQVTTTSLDGAVVLDWGNPTADSVTESQNFKGYTFEGYNVYQLAGNSPSLDGAKLLEVHDKVDGVGYIDDLTFDPTSGTTITKSVQFGTDFGLQHFYTTNTDAFSGAPLIDGHSYYYAVTAYNYNATSFPKTLESPPAVLAIIPQAPTPGTVLNSKPSDVISTAANTTTVGITDASIVATVVDPTRITGHIYKVTVNTGSPKTWNVIDSTTQTTKVSNVNVYGVDPINDPVVDGVQFSVLDPGVAGGINNVKVVADPSNPTSVPYNIIRAASPDGKWGMDGAGSSSVATAYSRINWQGSMGSNDYELRVTGTFGGNTAGQGSLYYIAAGGLIGAGSTTGTTRIPVEVWNITTNTRLLVNMLDDAPLDNKYGPSAWATFGGTPAAALASGIPYERFYCSDVVPYAEPLPNTSDASGATSIFGRVLFVDAKGTGYFPPVGTVIRFVNNKPVLPNNSFTLNTAAYAPVTGSSTAAKTTVQQINVWPNPYYGFNKLEQNKYVRFVTITHLPAKATIRIFALSGILVRTLLHNDPSQFQTWDLNNEAGLPVAAGMYIIYVDMPDLGVTKTLKLAVIPEMQFLDRY